jgi:hypothetical protein
MHPSGLRFFLLGREGGVPKGLTNYQYGLQDFPNNATFLSQQELILEMFQFHNKHSINMK